MSNDRLTVTLRLPPDVRDRLAAEARDTGQSMNSLIVERLNASLPAQASTITAVENAILAAAKEPHPLGMTLIDQVDEGFKAHIVCEEKVVQYWKENQFNLSLPVAYGHEVYLDRLKYLEDMRYRHVASKSWSWPIQKTVSGAG